jgi:hypothetical protein
MVCAELYRPRKQLSNTVTVAVVLRKHVKYFFVDQGAEQAGQGAVILVC